MKTIYSASQDMRANLDYTLDWSRWLVDGDTIRDFDCSITPAGGGGADVPLVCTLSAFTTTETVGWFSGGTEGQSYFATFHIETTDGRHDDRSIELRCVQR